MTKTILVLNGPNLNMLGQREPHIYGATTLAEVEAMCREKAKALGFDLAFHQSNHEGQIVEWIHGALKTAAGIVINPAAYTHTSVAILDALTIFKGPVIELHISNVHRREPFRHHSYVSATATAIICGLGVKGYPLAVEAIAGLIADAAAKA